MKAYIVCHPGGEPRYGWHSAGDAFLVDWNKNSGKDPDKHTRKFILRPGLALSAIDGRTMRDNLVFWGEYEAYSRARLLQKNDKEYPKAVHDILYPASGNFSYPQYGLNTDPYVYGDEFYYFCCERKDSGEQKYKPDDVILFGSINRRGNSYFFELDTVFVVKCYRSIEDFDKNSQYYKIGIRPHLDAQIRKGRSIEEFGEVVVGRMYGEGSDLYSYVPALPITSDNALKFRKPKLDLSLLGLKDIRNFQMNYLPFEFSKKKWKILTNKILRTHKLACYIDEI